ncbi:hypothetical protein Tco_0690815, partial [Tanacetum coccineum]
FNGAYDDDEDVGAVADVHNMDNTIVVSPIPTLRIRKDHPKGQILGDPTSAVQTRDPTSVKLEANAELTKDVLGKDLPEQDFAKRMAETVNQRKKHFAEERAKAKRNKPMTQSQLRIYMSNYLKNQGTWKLSQLKKLKFEEIKEEFDKFDDKDVPAIGDKVAEVKEEEPVKRTGKRKKQKARKGINVDKSAQEDLETDKEKSVKAMNPTPLTTKSDSVVNWKIFQQGQRSIYQIMRVNGADTKYGANRPEDAYDIVLWSDLMTMFDLPLNEDAIWSLPLQQKMVSWRDPTEVDIRLGGGRDKPLRPTDMLLYSWDGGLDVCVDLTSSSPLTQTRMINFSPGQAVIEAAQRKRVSDFTKVDPKILRDSRHRARAAVHIFNRIGFAIDRGVGVR